MRNFVVVELRVLQVPSIDTTKVRIFFCAVCDDRYLCRKKHFGSLAGKEVKLNKTKGRAPETDFKAVANNKNNN